MQRNSTVTRKTGETDVTVSLVLDGNGSSSLDTGIGFLDHMLAALVKHGGMDLTAKVRGDLEVDAHHTIEDLGLVLGQCLKEALGDKSGITRFGAACLPMDDALARVVLDFSGRPCLRYNVPLTTSEVGGINKRLFQEFFTALTNAGSFNLHIDLLAGDEIHHCLEAIFKAFGRAVRAAVAQDPKMQGSPSTKGILE